MNTHTLPIIGHHHSPLTQKFGIPRQPNLVAVRSQISFVPPFNHPDAFVGIENYSHLWILWQFHQNKTNDKSQVNFRPQVRPPRLGGNDKIGVFASRSMYRPSELGLSVVAFDRLQVIDNKVILHIIGADMVDGTPIVDVKPYLPFVDGVAGASGFDKPATKAVILTEQAVRDFDEMIKNKLLNQSDTHIIQDLIAQDPRVAYRQHEMGVMASMRYQSVDVDFYMNETGELVIGGVRVV